MRSRSPSKRRRHGSRGRSPPSSRHGCAKDKEGAAVSLFVSNLPRSCRPEDVQVPFQKFGPVRDVYLPKDYNTGEPRGFAFVEFAHSSDASKARYHMNRKMLSGREISVAFAVQTRKRPEEMRRIIGARHNSPQRKEECRTNSPGQPKGHDEKRKRRSYTPKYKDRQYADIGRDETPPAPDSERPWALCRSPRPSPPGQSHSRSYSRSHSLHLHDHARTRSCSPAPGRQDDQYASPQRKEHQTKSSGQTKGHDDMRRSYTPEYNECQDADNGFDETPPAPDGERSSVLGRSPRPSPPGHALLPQEGKITSLLPHREGRSTKQNHQDRLKNMMRSADPILLNIMIAGMLTMVMIRRRRHLMVSDPGHWAGHPSHPLQDGLIFIHTRVPALLNSVAVLDLGHALLPPEGKEMTSMLPHRERRSSKQNHHDRLKNMMRSEDPALLNIAIAVMLSSVMMRHRRQPNGGVNWALCRLSPTPPPAATRLFCL
ncbi:serine/arginine-rich SC35-like splicing factor SCL30A isoform X2 [Oryza glaberrima]|uniref:serine/arginine-rich SC35-like splicing factor SCL30A isoform X2 n=1 Tax=Oryza glaberrima TaxID=4538 RepID=UPI00224BF90B|nr:serine/arginine-rich SC35-like splicing factor SCL30A isoform X2 [Oryza glaberrima]